MINYAYNFARYYNICVIYVYGAVKKNIVQKLFDEKKFHIILLVASDVSGEDVKTIAEYDKWLSALKNQGLLKVINQGVPKGKYSKVIVGKEYGNEPSEEWFKMYNCSEWHKPCQFFLSQNSLRLPLCGLTWSTSVATVRRPCLSHSAQYG